MEPGTSSSARSSIRPPLSSRAAQHISDFIIDSCYNSAFTRCQLDIYAPRRRVILVSMRWWVLLLEPDYCRLFLIITGRWYYITIPPISKQQRRRGSMRASHYASAMATQHWLLCTLLRKNIICTGTKLRCFSRHWHTQPFISRRQAQGLLSIIDTLEFMLLLNRAVY